MASTPLAPRPEAEGAPSTAGRILDAAAALFAERGFAGCGVRDIAERAGLQPASLYNHFASKQALYEAVLERGMRPIFAILERAAAGADASEGDPLDALVEHLARAPDLARLLQHEALRGGEQLRRLAGRWLRPLYARGLAALRRSAAPGDFTPEELPLLLATYHQLIIGHFAMAGALGEVLGEDLLSREAVARQTRFLRKVTERLLRLEPAGEPARRSGP